MAVHIIPLNNTLSNIAIYQYITICYKAIHNRGVPIIGSGSAVLSVDDMKNKALSVITISLKPKPILFPFSTHVFGTRFFLLFNNSLNGFTTALIRIIDVVIG